MRKIFAVIVMFFLCVKICEAATKFVAFPTVGEFGVITFKIDNGKITRMIYEE